MDQAIALGFLGGFVGAAVGMMIGGLVAKIVVCNAGEGLVGQQCSMAAGFLPIFGVLLGGLPGVIVGVVVGARRPRNDPASATVQPLPRPHPSSAAWLALAGGLAIELGAFSRWRSVVIPRSGYYFHVLTFHAEVTAFLGGLGVLAGVTWRMLRPNATVPSVLLGSGCVIALFGVVWGMVDLLGAPSELERHLYVGFGVSAAGTALAVAGWIIDLRTQRRESKESRGTIPG